MPARSSPWSGTSPRCGSRRRHDGVVGINCLEKIQLATPTAILGAMLAGVDYVLMGAGIPREVPQLLRSLAAGEVGDPRRRRGRHRSGTCRSTRGACWAPTSPALTRPDFLAIVSLDQLASYLHRDAEIRPDGFVVERPPAGGHSAPPRGRMQLDEHGEPVYGPRDEADLTKMAAIGLPFWMAGAYGTPEQVAAAVPSVPSACRSARCSRCAPTRGSPTAARDRARPAARR